MGIITYLVMANRTPTNPVTLHTLIQDIPILRRVRMEAQRLRHIRQLQGQLKAPPGFPSIVCSIMLFMPCENERVSVVEWMLEDH